MYINLTLVIIFSSKKKYYKLGMCHKTSEFGTKVVEGIIIEKISGIWKKWLTKLSKSQNLSNFAS